LQEIDALFARTGTRTAALTAVTSVAVGQSPRKQNEFCKHFQRVNNNKKS